MDEKKAAARFDGAAQNLGEVCGRLFSLPEHIKAMAQEIRLRSGRPIAVSLPEETVFVTRSGGISSVFNEDLPCADRRAMDEAFRIICECSVHSHQREIKNGFITIRGGHRAGICGTAVTDGDTVCAIRDISSINLRIARDIDGAADGVAQALKSSIAAATPDANAISGALIFGPPGCGKTTVLRDLARKLSGGGLTGRHMRVAVVDERGEIAAACNGVPQNDLGPCCDILDGYPKGAGIEQAVRCLSPDVVICDEIGGESDASALEQSLNAGVAVIAAAHAGSLHELLARPQTASLIYTGAFKQAVLLLGRAKPGVVGGCYGTDELTYGLKEYRRTL